MTHPPNHDALDTLMQQLAAEVRDGAVLSEEQRVLDAWCNGELDAQEEAQLRVRAAQDPQVAEAMAAYAPLDELTRERFVAAAHESLAAQLRADVAPSSDLSGPRHYRLQAASRWGLPLLAIAAAMVLWLRTPTQSDSVDTLGAYRLVIEGQPSRERSKSTQQGHVRLARDRSAQFIFRPQQSGNAVPGVVAFRLNDDGTTAPLQFNTESRNGALKVELSHESLADLKAPSGRLLFLLHNGPTGFHQSKALGAATQDANVRRFEVTYELMEL